MPTHDPRLSLLIVYCNKTLHMRLGSLQSTL